MIPKLGKYSIFVIVAIALLGGVLIGYYAGRSTSKETYQVPTKNTCGPDALSAALAEFKIQAPPEKIAQLAGTDGSGTTMLGLKHAAETLGVKAVGLRLSQKELESYVKQGVGVIAFVNGDHYVWVKNIHPRGVVIKDIQPGFQFVPYEQWYSMWFEIKSGKMVPAEKGRGVCLIVVPK